MATSYSNLGGSGERRYGNIYAWAVTPASFGSDPNNTLRDSGVFGFAWGSSVTGEASLCYDFGSPRIVDEIHLLQDFTTSPGTWSVQASHDGFVWDTLRAAAPYPSALNVYWAFTNTTAYRFYRLHHASGDAGPSASTYWTSIKFKIDAPAPVGWYSPYSYGDRRSIITVPASSIWRGSAPNAIVSNLIMGADSSAYWGGGSGWSVPFDFLVPVALTGFRWFWLGLQNAGSWVIEASADSALWTPIHTFDYLTNTIYPRTSGGPIAASAEWDNTEEFRYWRFRQLSGTTSGGPYSGVLNFKVGGGVVPPPVVVEPYGGSLKIVGHTPSVLGAAQVFPSIGHLSFDGKTPVITNLLEISPTGGSFEVIGYRPTVSEVTLVYAAKGSLNINGGQPIIYTDAGALSSQFVVAVLGDEGIPAVAASQFVVAALGAVIPQARASQLLVAALVEDASCVTERCQLWTIRRRDGKVFRYTSLDVDFWWRGHWFKACGSMDPSAAQTGSALGDTGSVSLSGLITDDGVSEADLFGGLFDDAFVSIDLVNWQGSVRKPRRIASGWVGKVSHGPAFHTMEIMSASARLEQTALVQLVSPSCRWRFGDWRCKEDVESMKITGTVNRVINRGDLVLNMVAPPDDGRIWKSGTLRFLDGPAAGISVEYKEINFATGQVIMWSPVGLPPVPGNAVEILPGCDLTREGGCKGYNNIINFGGFPDVPGTDSVMETPDAKL